MAVETTARGVIVALGVGDTHSPLIPWVGTRRTTASHFLLAKHLRQQIIQTISE